jgi:hypothetical protein
MLRGDLSEEERQNLETRFLEDDAFFQELAREEEELLEAWEEGDLDAPTSRAVEHLVQTSTRIQTLVDMTHSFDDMADTLRPRQEDSHSGPLRSVLAYRPLPRILWALGVALGVALAVVLLLQYRMVRLLDQRMDDLGPGSTPSADGREQAPPAVVSPGSSPVVVLDAASTDRQLTAPFDRTSGLTVDIRLERTLLPGSYFLELEESSEGRIANRVDLSLERSVFPGNPLRVVIPGASLVAGDYRLRLFEGSQQTIAAWSLQLVEE